MSDRRWHFEDFAPGQVYELGERSLSEDEIVAFAGKWDPQYFHTDPVRAVDGPFGGLVASGWHTASLWARMFVDGILSRSVALGGPGVQELRFYKPTRPGERLRGRFAVLETRPSGKHADRGTVLGEALLVDDGDDLVMRFVFRVYLTRRSAGDAAAGDG